MLKLVQISGFLAMLAMATQQANAQTSTTLDANSGYKVEVRVEEEAFTGEAYKAFSTDKCTPFAIQHGIGVYKNDDVKKPSPPKQVEKPKDKTTGGSLSDLVEDVSELDAVLSAIEKVGTRVWKIIEANRPVVNVESKVANALPRDVDCWMDLENWQMPKSYKYNVTYKNLFGVEVVNFTFRVVYTYGASYNGHGKFLSNVSVHPANLDVVWGYTFNSKVEVQRLINLGTKEDPVAGMEMKLSWQISTPMKDTQESQNFFVTGNGEIKQN